MTQEIPKTIKRGSSNFFIETSGRYYVSATAKDFFRMEEMTASEKQEVTSAYNDSIEKGNSAYKKNIWQVWQRLLPKLKGNHET